MKKRIRSFWLILLPVAALLLFAGGGCQTGVLLAGILGSPTRHEKTVEAEYDLTGEVQPHILVLVNQPGWLVTRQNLRFHVTAAVNKSLMKKLDMPAELLFDYRRISESRSSGPAGSVSPAELGSKLGADMVLLVVLENYRLNNMPESDYLKGFLQAQAALLEVSTGDKLWPAETPYGKTIPVGFEIEAGGREVAVKRLARSLAHCITRYFYDCPMDQFRISDDRTGEAWENWER